MSRLYVSDRVRSLKRKKNTSIFDEFANKNGEKVVYRQLIVNISLYIKYNNTLAAIRNLGYKILEKSDRNESKIDCKVLHRQTD